MRWMVPLLVGAVMAGCLDDPVVAERQAALSAQEAHALVTPDAPEHIWVAAETQDAGLDGRAREWVIEYLDAEAFKVYRFHVTPEGVEARPAEPVPEPRSSGSMVVGGYWRDCPIHGTSADSTRVMERLQATKVYAALDVASEERVSLVLECAHGGTSWTVSTGLRHNEEGTWSARSFFLSYAGTLAGFFGDPSRGQPLTAGSANAAGVNVEEAHAFADATGPLQTSFQARNIVRMSVSATYSVPPGVPLAGLDGRIVATAPTGDEYSGAWKAMRPGFDGGAGTVLLHVPEAPPNAAAGAWQLRLETDPALPPTLGHVHFWVCGGVLYMPLDGPACNALWAADETA